MVEEQGAFLKNLCGITMKKLLMGDKGAHELGYSVHSSDSGVAANYGDQYFVSPAYNVEEDTETIVFGGPVELLIKFSKAFSSNRVSMFCR